MAFGISHALQEPLSGAARTVPSLQASGCPARNVSAAHRFRGETNPSVLEARTVTARTALRSATADDHRLVEEIFSRFRLGSLPEYRAFLRALAAAHVPVEAALDRSGAQHIVPDWPKRRRTALICDDLAELGDRCPPPEPERFLDDEAEVLGALYVLEGSRLGGAVLRRQVAPDLPQRFLGAPPLAGSWRGLSELLDRRLSDRQKLGRAIHMARQVFASFAAAGLAELEPAA
jgi:heme oxygenase (biliverdin-IX-beta and delta-forming)